MAPKSLLPKFVRRRIDPLLPDKTNIWLVGGAIRDRFIKRTTYDFDFAVAGDSRALGRSLADRLGGAYYDLDRDRETGRVLLHLEHRYTLDFAALRGPDIEADLWARDFSVNALAVPLSDPGHLLDPTGGLQDIRDKRIRACRADSIRSDPIRTLRAVRFANEFEFQIEAETLRHVRESAAELDGASPERVRDELFSTLAADQPARAVRVLAHLGLLARVCPEVAALERGPGEAEASGLQRAIARLEWLSRILRVIGQEHDPEAASDLYLAEVSLRLGLYRRALQEHLSAELTQDRTLRALLHLGALYLLTGGSSSRSRPDSGGREASARLATSWSRRMKLSRAETERLRKMVRWSGHLASIHSLQPITDLALYRYYRAAGPAGIDATLLFLSDHLAANFPTTMDDSWAPHVETARVLFEAYFDRRRKIVEVEALIRGDELIESFGLKPGPEIGRYLERIREAQVNGEIRTSKEARAWIEKELARESGKREG